MNEKKTANLAFLMNTGNGLEAICERCGHCKELDLLKLSVTYKQTATIAELEPKMAPCPRCGGKARLETIAKWLPPVI